MQYSPCVEGGDFLYSSLSPLEMEADNSQVNNSKFIYNMLLE